jgi:hypothetical protein
MKRDIQCLFLFFKMKNRFVEVLRVLGFCPDIIDIEVGLCLDSIFTNEMLI